MLAIPIKLFYMSCNLLTEQNLFIILTLHDESKPYYNLRRHHAGMRIVSNSMCVTLVISVSDTGSSNNSSNISKVHPSTKLSDVFVINQLSQICSSFLSVSWVTSECNRWLLSIINKLAEECDCVQSQLRLVQRLPQLDRANQVM